MNLTALRVSLLARFYFTLIFLQDFSVATQDCYEVTKKASEILSFVCFAAIGVSIACLISPPWLTPHATKTNKKSMNGFSSIGFFGEKKFYYLRPFFPSYTLRLSSLSEGRPLTRLHTFFSTLWILLRLLQNLFLPV